MAASDGKKGMVSLLLAHRAKVNLRDARGWTALHWAIDRGYTDLVKVLLANKADVNAMDNDGQTPLALAKEKGKKSVTKLLHQFGRKE
jgi:ankyrin repeat protein